MRKTSGAIVNKNEGKPCTKNCRKKTAVNALKTAVNFTTIGKIKALKQAIKKRKGDLLFH